MDLVVSLDGTLSRTSYNTRSTGGLNNVRRGGGRRKRVRRGSGGHDGASQPESGLGGSVAAMGDP